MTDEELIARLREIQGQAGLFASAAADRIEALVKARREDALELLAAHGQAQDAYEAQLKAEAQIAALTARVEGLTGALRELIDHTHNCERELTEELHKVDFCGESLPLTNARAALSATTEEGHE